MPSLSFKKEFVDKIISGEKRQTIRALSNRKFEPGCILYLFSGLRTKKCKRLNEVLCLSVKKIIINSSAYLVSIDRKLLSIDEIIIFAKKDGFDNTESFFDFFKTSVPFKGILIKW